MRWRKEEVKQVIEAFCSSGPGCRRPKRGLMPQLPHWPLPSVVTSWGGQSVVLAERCEKGEAQPDPLSLSRSCCVGMPLAREIALVEALVALELFFYRKRIAVKIADLRGTISGYLLVYTASIIQSN